MISVFFVGYTIELFIYIHKVAYLLKCIVEQNSQNFIFNVSLNLKF
jgi:hypothetical protein